MSVYASMYYGPPRHYGNTRTDKRYIAIHNTSNDATAEGEASYAKRREDSVSSHYYVDNNSIVQSLDTNLRAFHAGSSIGNSQAISYEITGTNGKSRAWWLDNVAWLLLSRQIAADCREHGIAARVLTVAEIEAGKLTGIITHDQMRQAWGGTTHTDPGPNFPMEHLLGLVVAELNGDVMADSPQLTTTNWRLYGLAQLADTVDNHVNNKTEALPLAQAVKRIDAQTAANGGALSALAAEVAEVKAAIAAVGTVTVTDEQLERVIRRVLGSVDGATPAAG